MEKAAQTIHDHFKRFGLQMHVGSKETNSKTEAMYFPSSLKEATENTENKTLPEVLLLNDGNNHIHFTRKFRYLGAHITTELNEDDEIQIRINKAKAQMGLLRHFFDCNDVDRKVKYWVYAAGPLNTLLWGCESWNLTERNLKRLSSFHHKAIKRILGLKWERVKEEKIMNEEVRR